MQDAANHRLTRLAAMPVPAAIDALEAGVFASIDENARTRTASRTMGAWSVGAALALGLFGGISLGGGATPGQAASPIGVDAALAPSTLLGR